MPTLKTITIFGAGGDNIGKSILSALLLDPSSFKVSILTRQSSKSTYPSSATILRVPDDLPHDALVHALKGQEIVISAVGFASGALETQYRVIDAAIEAGVKRFVPSEYGFDYADPGNAWLSPVFRVKGEVAGYLEGKVREHEGFGWMGLASGIWLEWYVSLSLLVRGWEDVDVV